jgi:hypothetical protein
MEKLLPLRFAGATANMQFENWVERNYPDVYDEWLLEASEYMELEEFLEHHCAIDILGTFHGLREKARGENRALYTVIEEWEALEEKAPLEDRLRALGYME